VHGNRRHGDEIPKDFVPVPVTGNAVERTNKVAPRWVSRNRHDASSKRECAKTWLQTSVMHWFEKAVCPVAPPKASHKVKGHDSCRPPYSGMESRSAAKMAGEILWMNRRKSKNSVIFDVLNSI